MMHNSVDDQKSVWGFSSKNQTGLWRRNECQRRTTMTTIPILSSLSNSTFFGKMFRVFVRKNFLCRVVPLTTRHIFPRRAPSSSFLSPTTFLQSSSQVSPRQSPATTSGRIHHESRDQIQEGTYGAKAIQKRLYVFLRTAAQNCATEYCRKKGKRYGLSEQCRTSISI